MRRLFFYFLIIVLCEESFGNEWRQEGAVIKNCNSKYVTKCSAITKRIKRGDQYRTNVTAIIIRPLYNNFTMKLSYGIKGYPNMFSINTKICDALETKWMKEYIRTFSNIPLSCPVLAGSYGFFNMELPPKNLPFPIPKADILYLTFLLELTDSKESIIEGGIVIRPK